MAARSTRRKIQDQGGKILQDFIRILEHLKFLDELANGQSHYINYNLPPVACMIEGCKEVTENFINGL